MDSKEFAEKISKKTGQSAEEVSRLSSSLVSAMLEQMAAGNVISVQGFGNFEAREKKGRKMYNPSSKTYMDVPSKTTVAYKMTGALKERLNER